MTLRQVRAIAPASVQNGRSNLCDYNGLDCLTGTNGTTGAQRFLAALSHRASAMLPFADEAALARLLIGAAAIAPAERG